MITCTLFGRGLSWLFLRHFFIAPLQLTTVEDLVNASDELLKSCGISAGQVLKIKSASGRFIAKSSEVRLELKIKFYLRLPSYVFLRLIFLQKKSLLIVGICK